MTLTLADILDALPGPWQRVAFKSTKTPPQRERAELALDDHLTLAVVVSTKDVQEWRLELIRPDTTPQTFEVYLLDAQGLDAAPGVLGLATTTEEAVAVVADKVTRAILCGREIHSLPPWLSFRVAERLHQAQDRLHRIALRFVTDPAADYNVYEAAAALAQEVI